MVKIYNEAKTSVRGIGIVEVVYVQQTRSSGQYEIGTSYVKGFPKHNPASEFADTLSEAMEKMSEQVMTLILTKQMMRSID